MSAEDDSRAGFLTRLRLEEAGVDRWYGRVAGSRAEQIPRGLLAAQGTMAAGRTVDTRWSWVHSVHVTHLAEGDPVADVEYRVERLRDTEHTANRLVRAMQGQTALAVVTVAFQTPRRGFGPNHQEEWSSEPPDPHSLPAVSFEAGIVPLLDVRYIDRAPWEPLAGPEAANRMWIRFTEELPDEILPHSAAIVFATESLPVEPVAPRSGEWTDLESGRGLHAVALDLSVRFHRSFRADDWVVHEHRSPSSADYRALSTGRFFSSMGRLVASVSQETALLPVADPVEHKEVAQQAGTSSGAGR
ncbi:acyl-CoA thioesterase [Streptosporangium sp. CA-115845]|uniref:acyl-CoA thioesterase n=1 Tax=Streptosporangium sp. CA-115845 TaxID=3240071 RepID=UPI003D91D4FF